MIGRRTDLVIMVLLVLFCFASHAQASSIKIVAGTSLVEDIVRDLTDGDAEIVTIIQGSSCPGHENIRTTDFVFAAKADIVLLHAFQKDLPQIASMLDAVNRPDKPVAILTAKGSWLIPSIQKEAVNDIAAILCALHPDKTGIIQERAQKRLAQIDDITKETLNLLVEIKGKRVIVAQMQSEFVTWAGAEVVDTYGRAEDMTPTILAKLVDRARRENIAGVIDNYQSGSEAGLPLALELKIPHLVLSNFPGSSDDAMDYFGLLRHNSNQLLLLNR